MKSKITQFILSLSFILIAPSLFAQYIVDDVFPTRVTTTTEITVIRDLGGLTNGIPVFMNSISYNSKTASNGGTQLNFSITRTGSNLSGPLQINGEDVYIGSVDPAKQSYHYLYPTNSKNL